MRMTIAATLLLLFSLATIVNAQRRRADDVESQHSRYVAAVTGPQVAPSYIALLTQHDLSGELELQTKQHIHPFMTIRVPNPSDVRTALIGENSLPLPRKEFDAFILELLHKLDLEVRKSDARVMSLLDEERRSRLRQVYFQFNTIVHLKVPVALRTQSELVKEVDKKKFSRDLENENLRNLDGKKRFAVVKKILLKHIDPEIADEIMGARFDFGEVRSIRTLDRRENSGKPPGWD